MKNNVPGSRYINASFINGPLIPEHNQIFIATQAPIPYTTNDFWQMIFSQNTSSIFNLCSQEDCKKVKIIQGSCEVYWPDAGKSLKFGSIEVKNLGESEEKQVISRNFDVFDGQQLKNIKFFQYLAWPDRDVPKDLEGLSQMMENVKELQNIGKVVVHCSAGVGRTGTFIALCNLKRLIDEQFAEKLDFGVSVFSAVRRLREQRMHMVQTKEQYQFIHDMLEKWIDGYNVKNEGS
jgi:protein tyrosine phosphatase